MAKSFVEKVSSFIVERAKWIACGRPMRDKERMVEIYNICSNGCSEFENESCKICGCGLSPTRRTLNKIAWATTQCPHERRYWTKDSECDKNASTQNIKSATIESQVEERDGGQGCGCSK